MRAKQDVFLGIVNEMAPKIKGSIQYLWSKLVITHAGVFLQRKSLDRPDSPECQLSPVAVGTVLTPPSSTEKPANH